MNTFNIQPRPRVLFEDVPEVVLKELVRLVPSYKLTFPGDEVHESEYDLLVTFAENAGIRGRHLHVLSFGASQADSVQTESGMAYLVRDNETLAHEVTICAGAPAEVAELLKLTVIPAIPNSKKRTWRLISSAQGFAWASSITGDLEGRCVPLLHLGKEQFVYAFLTLRDRNTGGLHLALPGVAEQPAEWLRLFLDMVARADPDSVPPEVEWKTSEQWSPPEVATVAMDLQTLREEQKRLLQQFRAREQALMAELAAASQEADAGPRRLLTGDGDDLVDAVLESLQDLGFRVRDMDDHHDEKTGAKLEDLRVDDPSDPEWHCLAEVKGYKKGAKVNDVSQVTGRPTAAYTKETSNFPSTVWHIVNAWREKPPSTRPIAIPNEDDLQPLTDAGGALIDSRDLFEAWRDVRAGKLGAEVVRESLRSAVTRWTYG